MLGSLAGMLAGKAVLSLPGGSLAHDLGVVECIGLQEVLRITIGVDENPQQARLFGFRKKWHGHG